MYSKTFDIFMFLWNIHDIANLYRLWNASMEQNHDNTGCNVPQKQYRGQNISSVEFKCRVIQIHVYNSFSRQWVVRYGESCVPMCVTCTQSTYTGSGNHLTSQVTTILVHVRTVVYQYWLSDTVTITKTWIFHYSLSVKTVYFKNVSFKWWLQKLTPFQIL